MFEHYMKRKEISLTQAAYQAFCRKCNKATDLPHKCPDGTEYVKILHNSVGM